MLSDSLKKIGIECRKQRKSLGLTQLQAAERSGLHRTIISLIENGRFNGTIKALIAYTLVLKLELTVRLTYFPQLDELDEIFKE